MSRATVWRRLSDWYRRNGRDLPWRALPGKRKRVGDYEVAVSEFMLQQTQVDRVLPLYRAFLKRFPSWRALARAPQADVVRAWKGLGYNLRAVRLRTLAQVVVEKHGGRLPSSLEDLLSLKGIGPYTARALRVFAFHETHLAPDTNIRRVLTRLFRGPLADPASFSCGRKNMTRLWDGWEKTLPSGEAYDINQALMDIGATICTARAPRCPACPLKADCRSYPRILSLRRLPSQKPSRKEKTDEHGLPDRIYRGRIVDLLRAGPRPTSELEALGSRIKVGYSAKDRSWLRALLKRLEKDGLILTSAARIRLA